MTNFINNKLGYNEDELLQKAEIEYPESFVDMLMPCNWITDAKISACFCKKGIAALDYHGTQPVSRNSRMVKSGFDNPALKFISDGDLSLCDYRALPFKCVFNLKNDDKIAASAYSLAFESGLFLHIDILSDFSFYISFDTESFYTNVHGNISWDKGRIKKDCITFKGLNRYLLSEWIKEKGAYLVPVKEHKRIFNTDDWIDVNNLDILPVADEDILRSDELFIDSECHITFFSSSLINIKRDKNKKTILFSTDVDAKSIDLCICFGDTGNEAETKARKIIDENELLIKLQNTRYNKIIEDSPVINIEGYEGAKKLFSSIPMYVESAKQKDSGMTRASSSSYYWVWGWDNIVTAMEMSKWNDYKGQKDIISFILSHRWLDGSVPHRYDREYNVMQTMHFCSEDALFIILTFQYCADADDYDFLKDIYPDILHIWKGLLSKTDSKGYIVGPGFYPDNLKVLGRKETSRTAMETGTFYTACRIMEILSSIMNDHETKKHANKIFTSIEDNYLKDFFNVDYGTIADSIYDDNSQNETFPLYAYMGAYTSFGFPLFCNEVERIASFINQNCIHPMGIRVMPIYDKNRNSESIHHSWYSHWDIYALKLLRNGFMFANDRSRSKSAITHYVSLMERMWEGYKASMELLELDTSDYIEGWKQHGQAWNCNCATGMFRSVIESVSGIITDFGTITVLADNCSISNISNLHIRGGRWDISHVGEKEFTHIFVDGIKLKRTCVIPDEFMTSGSHRLQVFYTSEKQDFRILNLIGGRIREYSESESSLSFKAECEATADLVIASKNNFHININNVKTPFKKIANDYYTLRLNCSCNVEILL